MRAYLRACLVKGLSACGAVSSRHSPSTAPVAPRFYATPISYHAARAQVQEVFQEADCQVCDRLLHPRGGPRPRPLFVREVLARPHQGQRQGRTAGRRRHHRQGEGAHHRDRPGSVLEALPQVPHQEVPQEAAAARLPPRDRQHQEHLRAAILLHRQRPAGGGRRVDKCRLFTPLTLRNSTAVLDFSGYVAISICIERCLVL